MSYKGEAELAGKMASNISLSKVMITIISIKIMKTGSNMVRYFCAVNAMNLIIDIKNLS